MADDSPWWASSVIYQVYPRSFADSDGDGIGDLPGIIGHLDHLVDLGVDAIWVSPFFASPQRDVGYDVSDYRGVAPEYGTLEDAQRLIDEAHARGLRVLFDLVLNHTSDEHPWFIESRSSRDNPKAGWYVWADGGRDRKGRPTPPNNWRSELQLPRAWQWCPEREQWFLATFLSFQPDLNWRNPDVRAEMFDMVRMWLGRGVDGFRLDIFGSIMHDEALRDNEARPGIVNGMPRLQQPTMTLNTDENFALAGDLRAVCDEFDGDRALLGEVFGEPEVLRRYVSDDGRPGLHLVFLFEFLASRYSADAYRRLIEQYERDFPAPLAPTYVVENHDRTRSLSRLGGDLDKARVLATLLCTLRGVPVLYQGQEIGMENRYVPMADAIDPVPSVVARHLPEVVNRRLPERLNRDEVRTPMQWTSARHAGFCPDDVEPWLPVHENRRRRNVDDESGDPGSLLSWYRELLALRRAHPALANGTLEVLTEGERGHPDPPGILRYHRDVDDDHLVVVANLSRRPVQVLAPVTGADAILAASAGGVGASDGRVSLPPHTTAIAVRDR
ncbi:MAG: alpha-glucosidase [Acidimicrobiales bacterium]|nr:alpha-glucosidase [Acidimicrobiales bacterium]